MFNLFYKVLTILVIFADYTIVGYFSFCLIPNLRFLKYKVISIHILFIPVLMLVVVSTRAYNIMTENDSINGVFYNFHCFTTGVSVKIINTAISFIAFMVFNILTMRCTSHIFDMWCIYLLPFVYVPICIYTRNLLRDGLYNTVQLDHFSIASVVLGDSKMVDNIITDFQYCLWLCIVILCFFNTYIRKYLFMVLHYCKSKYLDEGENINSDISYLSGTQFEKDKAKTRERLARQMTLLLLLYTTSSFVYRIQWNLSKISNHEWGPTMSRIFIVISLSAPILFSASYLIIQTNPSGSSKYGKGLKICHLIRNKKLYLSFRSFLVDMNETSCLMGLDFIEQCEDKKEIPHNPMFVNLIRGKKFKSNCAAVYYFDETVYSISKSYLHSKQFERFKEKEESDALNCLGDQEPWLNVKKMDSLMRWNEIALDNDQERIL